MKWLARFVGLYVATLLGVAILAVVYRGSTTASPEHVGAYPGAVVASDWAMTQQMGVSFGPGMDQFMQGYGMLERSQDPAYLSQLAAYQHEIDRMLGRSP